MNNGFCVVINNNPQYLKLLEVLINSILDFTDKPIEVFCINFDFKHPNSRVITTRNNVSIESYETLCYQKIYAALNCKFENTLMIDSDMIVTPEVNKLFDEFHNVDKFPLAAQHLLSYPKLKELRPTMNILNVKEPTMPYVQAHYLYNNSCKDFLEECWKTSLEFQQKNFKSVVHDESIINVLLWKYGCKKYIDCFQPHYKLFIDRTDNMKKHMKFNLNQNINYYISHGCKDYKQACYIYNNIKNRLNKGN